jgi:hypothetical protein
MQIDACKERRRPRLSQNFFSTNESYKCQLSAISIDTANDIQYIRQHNFVFFKLAFMETLPRYVFRYFDISTFMRRF